jgi:hypothetical protein
MKNLWNREPTMFLAVIQTGLALATGFGLNLSGEQVAAIMAFAAAIFGLITRSQVTPVK